MIKSTKAPVGYLLWFAQASGRGTRSEHARASVTQYDAGATDWRYVIVSSYLYRRV